MRDRNSHQELPPLKVQPSNRPTPDERLHLVRTLLVVDLVSSEVMLRGLGDDGYANFLEQFKDRSRLVLGSHRGEEIADTGDGYIYAFVSPAMAITAAAVLHQVTPIVGESRPRIRCGVHSGQLTLCRYGVVGAALYEAVELGNAAGADEVWLSLSAAEDTPYATAPHDFVELPRSGLTPVIVLHHDSGMGRLSGPGQRLTTECRSLAGGGNSR